MAAAHFGMGEGDVWALAKRAIGYAFAGADVKARLAVHFDTWWAAWQRKEEEGEEGHL